MKDLIRVVAVAILASGMAACDSGSSGGATGGGVETRSLDLSMFGDAAVRVTGAGRDETCTEENCSYAFPPGSVLELSFQDNPGWTFRDWLGCPMTSVAGNCLVTLEEDTELTAVFMSTVPLRFNPDSVMLRDEQIRAIVAYGAEVDRLEFQAGTDLNGIRAGSVLVSNGVYKGPGHVDNIDIRFFRRVLRITQGDGGRTVMFTEKARLTDWIIQGSVGVTVEGDDASNPNSLRRKAYVSFNIPTPPDTELSFLFNDTCVQPGGDGVDWWSLELDVRYECDIQLNGSAILVQSSSERLKVTGHANVTVGVEAGAFFNVDGPWPYLERAKVYGGAYAQTTLGVEFSGGWSGKQEKDLTARPLPLAQIGPIALTLQPKLYAQAEVGAKLYPQFTGRIEQRVEIEYTDASERWKAKQSHSFSTGVNFLGGNGTSQELASFTAGVEAGLQFEFKAAAEGSGITLTPQPYVGLTARVSSQDQDDDDDPHNCRIVYGPYYGFKVAVGAQLELFGADVASYSNDLADFNSKDTTLQCYPGGGTPPDRPELKKRLFSDSVRMRKGGVAGQELEFVVGAEFLNRAKLFSPNVDVYQYFSPFGPNPYFNQNNFNQASKTSSSSQVGQYNLITDNSTFSLHGREPGVIYSTRIPDDKTNQTHCFVLRFWGFPLYGGNDRFVMDGFGYNAGPFCTYVGYVDDDPPAKPEVDYVAWKAPRDSSEQARVEVSFKPSRDQRVNNIGQPYSEFSPSYQVIGLSGDRQRQLANTRLDVWSSLNRGQQVFPVTQTAPREQSLSEFHVSNAPCLQVLARDAAGNLSDPSSPICLPQAGRPDRGASAPDAPVVTGFEYQAGSNSALLQWSSQGAVASFWLKRDVYLGNSSFPLAAPIKLGASTRSVTLPLNGIYWHAEVGHPEKFGHPDDFDQANGPSVICVRLAAMGQNGWLSEDSEKYCMDVDGNTQDSIDNKPAPATALKLDEIYYSSRPELPTLDLTWEGPLGIWRSEISRDGGSFIAYADSQGAGSRVNRIKLTPDDLDIPLCFRVVLLSRFGIESDPSAPVCAEVTSALPSPPENLQAQVVDGNVIELSWGRAALPHDDGVYYDKPYLHRIHIVDTSTQREIVRTGYPYPRDDPDEDHWTWRFTWFDDFGDLRPDTVYCFSIRTQSLRQRISEPTPTVCRSLDLEPPGPAANLQVRQESANAAFLNWSAASDNQGIDVYEIDTTGGDYFGDVNGTEQDIVISALRADVEYCFTVTARDFGGNRSDPTAPACITLDGTPPATPVLDGLDQIAGPALRLRWLGATDNRGVTGYDVRTPEGQVLASLDASARQWTMATAEEGTRYCFIVVARDAAGNRSAPSSTVCQVVDTQPPAPPSGLALSQVNASTLRLSWQATTDNVGVDGYRIASPQGVAESSVTSDVLQANFGSLQPDVEYCFTVTAVDAAGNVSDASDQACAIIDVTPPTPPGAPGLVQVSDSSLRLSWGAATDNQGVTGYVIRQAGGSAVVGSVGAGTLDSVIGSLQADVEYCYTVTAVDAVGNISAATVPVCATIDASPPTRPVLNDLVQTDTRSLRLSWSPSSDNRGVTDYEVRSQAGELVDRLGAATLAHTISPLQAEVEHCFAVTAFDLVGNASEASAPLCAIIDATPPTEPSPLQLESVDFTSLHLSWGESTDNRDLGGYRILTEDGSVFAEVAAGTQEMRLEPLADGQKYCFTVVAFDAVNNQSTSPQPVCAFTYTDPPETWELTLGCADWVPIGIGQDPEPLAIDQEPVVTVDLTPLDPNIDSDISISGEAADYDGRPLAFTISGYYEAQQDRMQTTIDWELLDEGGNQLDGLPENPIVDAAANAYVGPRLFEGESRTRQDNGELTFATDDSGELQFDNPSEGEGCDAVSRVVLQGD